MSNYRVIFSPQAEKQFKKLDKYTQTIMRNWINKNLSGCADPRRHGKALSGNLKGLWRYRVLDYRIIATINDEEIFIYVLEVGHRRDIYN